MRLSHSIYFCTILFFSVGYFFPRISCYCTKKKSAHLRSRTASENGRVGRRFHTSADFNANPNAALRVNGRSRPLPSGGSNGNYDPNSSDSGYNRKKRNEARFKYRKNLEEHKRIPTAANPGADLHPFSAMFAYHYWVRPMTKEYEWGDKRNLYGGLHHRHFHHDHAFFGKGGRQTYRHPNDPGAKKTTTTTTTTTTPPSTG